MRCSASAQRVKEVSGNVCASGKKKKQTIFSFFIEGKINNWSWLICLGPSDAQVSNCFLNVSENNSVLRFVLCY